MWQQLQTLAWKLTSMHKESLQQRHIWKPPSIQSLECKGIGTCCDEKRSETAKSKPKTFCSDLVPSSARKIHNETSQESDTHLIIVDKRRESMDGEYCSVSSVCYVLSYPAFSSHFNRPQMWRVEAYSQTGAVHLQSEAPGIVSYATCLENSEHVAGNNSKKDSITSLKLSW